MSFIFTLLSEQIMNQMQGDVTVMVMSDFFDVVFVKEDRRRSKIPTGSSRSINIEWEEEEEYVGDVLDITLHAQHLWMSTRSRRAEVPALFFVCVVLCFIVDSILGFEFIMW